MTRVRATPRVRAATLNGYVPLAESLGLDPEQLIRGVGLDPADVASPDRWIPAPPVARLLDLSAAEANAPDFALRLAGLRRMSTLGPLGLVLPGEPTLRSALDLLIRYQRAYNEALHMQLDEGGGPATVRIWLEFGEPAPTRQATELAVAALTGIVRMLRGPTWRPISTCFNHAAPLDVAPHQQVFGSPIRFGHDFTALILSSTELDTPNEYADPQLKQYTKQLLDSLAYPRGASPADRVRELVEVMLPLGRCSMDHVARTLGMDPRTLRRHLTDHDESFSGIVDATRAALAERYLANPRYTLTDISALLGFDAPSAFSRWFRRQFDATPTQWRSHASPTGSTSEHHARPRV